MAKNARYASGILSKAQSSFGKSEPDERRAKSKRGPAATAEHHPDYSEAEYRRALNKLLARDCDRASEFDLSLALTLHRQQHIADPSLMRADAVIYPGFAISLPMATYLRAAQEKGHKL